MYIRIKYILYNFALPAQVANWCVCIVLYRQYMHEVFHSFPLTSPSRVTIWWGAISWSDWWRWLAHDSTTHCALKCTCNKLWGGTAIHTHTLTYTVHMCTGDIYIYIPLLAMYVHGTHCMTSLYVNTYACICRCILCIAAPLCGAICIWLLWRFSV